jgi:hypothetical protein
MFLSFGEHTRTGVRPNSNGTMDTES